MGFCGGGVFILVMCWVLVWKLGVLLVVGCWGYFVGVLELVVEMVLVGEIESVGEVCWLFVDSEYLLCFG